MVFGKIRQFKQSIRDVISIGTYCYMAKWLWGFEREYGSLRNVMTMVYGFVCLLWTPRFSPRSIVYSFFVVGVYGFLIKWMWLEVRRDYLELGCKSFAVIFGAKGAYLTWGLISLYCSGT